MSHAAATPIQQAREPSTSLRVYRSDHHFIAMTAKTAVYLRGACDGLVRVTIPQPRGRLIPPISPESTPSSGRAYRQGAALADGVHGAEGKEGGEE